MKTIEGGAPLLLHHFGMAMVARIRARDGENVVDVVTAGGDVFTLSLRYASRCVV